MNCRMTHIGTATVILEIGSLRLLTDPVFDPAGSRYSFGWGTRSRKLAVPSIPVESVGRIDAVLLSHDQHGDNLDSAGRAFLPKAGRVLTTVSAERRLRGSAEGLRVWSSVELQSKDGLRVRVTATPARHGPPCSRLIVGDVIGFILEWDGQKHGTLYISGDTVWFDGVAEVARRHKVGTALLHLGGVRFPISGPLRYTFNGAEAARAALALQARTVIPIHYEGWTHFRETRSQSEKAFAAANISDRVLWLPPGVPTSVEA
ncbi:MAG: MBL fold metallo-hydrolase [Acidobacteria bacterium]|nr:MBL fold metallo-hydrolase [Acidobacteriota bacterium]